MKKILLACVFAAIPAMAMAEPVKTFGSVNRLDSNVGSRIGINVVLSGPSSFRGTLAQKYQYNNGATNFTRNFNISGNANYRITSQINNDTSVFTNNNSFVFNNFSFFNR